MYLGCTFDEYKIFLEKKFKENMEWSNMGGKNGWHIDHIKPLASFDLSKKTEQLKAFNYNFILLTKQKLKTSWVPMLFEFIHSFIWLKL